MELTSPTPCGLPSDHQASLHALGVLRELHLLLGWPLASCFKAFGLLTVCMGFLRLVPPHLGLVLLFIVHFLSSSWLFKKQADKTVLYPVLSPPPRINITTVYLSSVASVTFLRGGTNTVLLTGMCHGK